MINHEIDDWWESANCASVDPEIFHPEKGGSTAMAKKVCDMCEVRSQCLEEVLTLPKKEQIGFVAGLNPKQRKAILKGLVVVE